MSATNVQSAIDELRALIPRYVTTGLSIIQNRCALNDGGYYINNGYVYVDITLTLLTNVGANYGLITGFPQGAGTGRVTPVLNNAVMLVETLETSLCTDASQSSGTSIHFIGSYQLKTS